MPAKTGCRTVTVQACKGLGGRFHTVVKPAQGNRYCCCCFAAVGQAEGLHAGADSPLQLAVFQERRLLSDKERGKKIVKSFVLKLNSILEGKGHDS